MIGFLGLLGVALGAVVVLLWIFQERVVFQPPMPVPRSTHADLVHFTAPGGQLLHAYVIEPTADAHPGQRGAVVFFHGNADLAESRIDWAIEGARRARMPIVLAEYRGYGGLPGRPSYENAISDARATIAMVKTRFGINDSDLILYGHSLGTGIASEVAKERGARAMMLECPYTSIADLGRVALLPPVTWALPLIMRVKFAPLAMVQQTSVPVWVALAGHDNVIPPSMSRSVFHAARMPGELLEVKEAGHTDLPDAGGSRYWEWFTHGTKATAPQL